MMRPATLQRHLGGILFALFLLPQIAAAQTTPLMPDGTLIRTYSDPKVYYIEHSSRRWVESEEAFRAQGFEWPSIVYIPDADLGRYAEGPPVKPDSLIILPSEFDSLPDLAPFAAEDIRLVTVDSRLRLKFTTSIWNRGKGAVELRTRTPIDASRDGTYAASQRIFHADGSHRDRSVGDIYWHRPHAHFHYINFADYSLERVKFSGEPVEALAQKTGFCLRDDVIARMEPQGIRQKQTYAGCGGGRQGISVGWVDVYGYFLPDQYFDVTDLPAGTYRLAFSVDPLERFAEATRNNNVSIALLDLDPKARTVKVIAFASPFTNSWNRYPEGMLVQAEGHNEVYMVQGNKKRWLRSEEVFMSYGRGWGEIYVWPPSLVEAIPDGKLIRQAGTNGIYVLNGAGWKRRVLTPTVMSSYGWTSADVADISPVELAAYPATDLVRLENDDRVYSLSSKSVAGTTAELAERGADLASIHTINQTDFNAYGF